VIPPEYNPQFVWRMEQILDLYEEPYDPKRPVVCFDENTYFRECTFRASGEQII